MPTTFSEDVTNTDEGVFLWNQERSLLEATELACEIMNVEGVSRSELAGRLGKTKGYITQLLDGSTNMTIRTISDLFAALGYAFHPDCSRLDGSPTLISRVRVEPPSEEVIYSGTVSVLNDSHTQEFVVVNPSFE